MRTEVLLNAVDASANQTSNTINFEQRAEWLLQLSKSGTDGTPNLIIEFTIDNAAGVWTPLQNPETLLYVFPLDDSPLAVRDDRLQGKFFRIRIEPNDNTTGTVTADLGYKTYP